ncbi:hypothetical protein BH10BAC4_BH10BAC4_12920 [soil metagenome]
MELLESQDPQKKKLIETSERHKRALEKEVSSITEKTDKMVTNALIIGGSLAATYFLVSLLSGGTKKKKRRKKVVKVVKASGEESESVDELDEEDHSGPSIISAIGNRLLSQASVMLLEIAKEKLFEYLESRKKENENS